MSLPTALQAQLDKVNAAQQEHAQEPDKAQPQNHAEPGNHDQPPANRQAGPQPQPEEKARQQGNPDQAPRSEDWKHKFDVINGKYVSETGRLRAEVGLLRDSLRRATAELDALRVRHPDGATQIQPRQPGMDQDANIVGDDEVKRLVKPDLIEEFGVDYWKQQIALQRALQGSRSPAQDRIEQVEGRLEDQSRRAFYTELSALVPEWEQINSSKEFDEFLGGVEPLTGTTFESLLQDAYRTFDSARVARLFQRFLGEFPDGKKKAPSVESQVMPSGRSVHDAPAAGATMSFEDWTKKMQGLTSGGMSPTEAVKRKQELMDAYQQGRVAKPNDGAGAGAPSFV